MTTCELRLKAAEDIEKHGLCKRGFRGWDNSVCVIGGLLRANGHIGLDSKDISNVNRGRRYRPIRDAVVAIGFRTLDEAAHWNDAPERTKEDVIARLRAGCLPAETR